MSFHQNKCQLMHFPIEVSSFSSVNCCYFFLEEKSRQAEIYNCQGNTGLKPGRAAKNNLHIQAIQLKILYKSEPRCSFVSVPLNEWSKS